MSSHQKSHRRLMGHSEPWITIINSMQSETSLTQTVIFSHNNCLPLHSLLSQTPAPEKVRGQQRHHNYSTPLDILWNTRAEGDTLGQFLVFSAQGRAQASCHLWCNPVQEIIVLVSLWFYLSQWTFCVGETPAYDHLSLESNSNLSKLFFT